MSETINIEYYTVKRCYEKLVSEIAQDVRPISDALFQCEMISEDTHDKVRELNETAKNKARLVVNEIAEQVKRYPTCYQQLLTILGANKDIVQALEDERTQVELTSQNESLQELFNLGGDVLPPTEVTIQGHRNESILLSLPELPTADDMGTVPNPLESPPDSEEVGRDIRAASLHKLPSVGSLERQVLQIIQTGESTEATELLSQPDIQTISLKGVCDSDGKTLLHLVCCKNWLDWYPVFKSLVEEHDCDVSAVDEDGNTPLHDAYQCGNKNAVTYLLSIPTCNPDAFNKDGVSVLRMALRVNDKEITRKLLATGRVDPRRGSTRGHTYEELLRVDGLLPQNIDGSTLQMVSNCAQCIENSNHFHPRYTFYYLMSVLFGILRNRDQVSIAGIVEGIKQSNLPLPEKEDEIYNLLMDMSEEFEVIKNPGSTSEGQFQIRTKGQLQQNSIPLQNMTQFFYPMPSQQSSTQQLVEHPHAHSDPPPGYQLHSEPPPLYSDSQTEGQQRSHGPPPSSHYEPPDVESDTSNLLPISFHNSSGSKKKKKFGLGIIAVFLFACFFIVSSILEIYGDYFYNPFFPVSSTNVTQIQRPSVPLIGKLDGSLFVQLAYTVNEASNLPITFYSLQQCSNQDSLLKIEVDETMEIAFNSQNSKSLSDWYFLANTTLTVTITTDVLPNYPADHCIAFIVVFDYFNEFKNFNANSSLNNGYNFMECITNEQFQTKYLTFSNQSYYFLGLYSDNSIEVGTFFIHTVGSYLEYNTSKSIASCSIDSSSSSTTCDFNPDVISEDTCLVGLVQRRITDAVPPRATTATVVLSTAVVSEMTAMLYFSSPLITIIVLLMLFLIFLLTVLVIYLYRRRS